MNTESNVTLHTGNKMPVMGLGTWQLTIDTPGIIDEAIDLGYRMIDTSGDYGTQPGIGEGLKQAGKPRNSYYIVTKIEEDDDAYQATARNLDELQLEFADLILIHRHPGSRDQSTRLWEGLIRAKEDSLTRDIGVSNYSVSQIQELIDSTGEVPAVNQIEWSPFGHSQEMLEYCQARGIIIQAYSPLTRTKRLDDATLNDLAAMYQRTPAQILIRWNLQLGTVPLPKANKIEHLEENIRVLDFEIGNDDMATLNGLNEGYSSLGPTLKYL